MKTITSTTNPEIKLLRELHTSKGRKEHKKFLAEGIRTCSTLIEHGAQLVQLYTTEQQASAATHITKKSHITIIADHIMEKISTATTPSGILGVFQIPTTPGLAELKPGLVLANISDPGNVGTLIRTAVALNLPTVVIIEGADIWSPKVIQATAGTIAQIKIFDISWQTLVKWKKELQLCALVVKNGQSPQDIPHDNLLLVVGNEAHGINPEWLQDCQSSMTIPMPGNAESLNAAVAGSIGAYLVFNRYR